MKRATALALSSFCSQVVHIYLQPWQCNSFLKCAPPPKIEKNTKTLYFGGLRSFKVIDVDSIKKLVTSACYDEQYICVYLQMVSR